MDTLTTIDAVRAVVAAARERGERVALVPTMGALHDGHLALVEEARTHADVVLVSIFVNPMQFGPTEDLARYPRDLEADRERLAAGGVAGVFAPTVDVMYPSGSTSATVVTAGHLGTVLEGRSRPGHYDGVLTVVSKLLHIVGSDVAIFGEKDAQQLFLVRRMVADLDMPVRIVGVPTVRDADGLALSSRNRFLTADERRTALQIPRALEAAGAAADRGVEAMLAAAQGVLQSESGVRLDYLAVVDPSTFAFAGEGHRGAVQVLVAARVGTVRLIDTATYAIP